MHIDARTLDDGSLIEGDICIIGAGAAGISMGFDWIGSNQRVILLEGGGFEIEAELQDLYHGESIV
jgi:thioredoxin reductase